MMSSTRMSDFFENACAVLDPPAAKVGADDAGALWSAVDPLLKDGQVVRGGMFEHQRAWWNLPNFIRILVGGFGSGKTHLLCKRAIANALQNAPCPVAMVSPTYSMARETTVLTANELIAGKKTIHGRKLKYKYNRSTNQLLIRFRGRDARIIFYSGEKPDRLRGPNLAAAYIDEPFIQDVDVFHQMIARVRHPDAVHREIGLSGTPEQLNWGYDLCVGESKDRHDVGYIRAATSQNLALDEEYVERMKGAFAGKAAAAYIQGEFVNITSGLVYYAFDPSVNVRDIPIPDGARLGVGMDFNVNPMSAAIFWRLGQHIHFFDEMELPNADTEFLCCTLRDKYGDRLDEVYPDATGSARKTAAPGGRSDYWYIRNAGYTIHAPHVNPKRRDRFNAVNGKLKPMQGDSSLTFSPKCKRLIKYLSLHSYELMNKQHAMSHLLDAMGYPVSHLFPVTRSAMGVYKLRGV